jgi:hypothetical protein
MGFNPIKNFKATLGIFSKDKGKTATIIAVADDNEPTTDTFVKIKIGSREDQKRIAAFENPKDVLEAIS